MYLNIGNTILRCTRNVKGKMLAKEKMDMKQPQIKPTLEIKDIFPTIREVRLSNSFLIGTARTKQLF